MTSFSDITLCCVDTEHHLLSAVALRRCNELMPFSKTVFITDRDDYVDPDWELHRIKTLADYKEYNRFMLKHLYFHIETDFVLSVQFDGFMINPEAWTDDFLQYDYIGGPWPSSPKEYAVGTGGFSLRSRRLLKALQDDRIVLPRDSVAEDLCISRTYRSILEVHHGIRFAPVELAAQFCYETGPFVPDTFGFHGLPRLADFYTGENAKLLADNLKPYVLRKMNVVVLAMQYAFREQHYEARYLFKRISRYQSHDEAHDQLVAASAPADMIAFLAQCWPRYLNRNAA
jgi:hypothetical protein